MKLVQLGPVGPFAAFAMVSMAAALAPMAAQATPSKVHFYTSNGSFSSSLNSFGLSPDSNILFNESGLTSTGDPVQGHSNTSPKFIVDFRDKAGINLTENAKGQSDIDAQSGTYSDLTIYLDKPTDTFQSLSFQINPTAVKGVKGNAKLGTDTITLTGDNLDTTTSTLDIYNSGLNFFGVIVEPGSGEDLKSVSVSGNVCFDDLRQFRMGGIENNCIDPAPEPCTLALLGTGALPMLGVLRRRRKS